MKRPINLLIFLTIFSLPAVDAEDGISEEKIVLGQSCALSGPAEALGKGMRSGLMSYFSMVNEAGGIKGRRIELFSLDDGYEPRRAIENTRQLITVNDVFLLIGEVGTPTSKASVPIAEASGVPFFGPFTGAEFLRNPFKRYVINVRGSSDLLTCLDNIVQIGDSMRFRYIASTWNITDYFSSNDVILPYRKV